MSRNYLWKLLLVLAVIVWSLFEINPPAGRNLADEFARRAVLRDEALTNILERLQPLQQEHPERAFANVLEAVGTNDITRYFPFFEAQGELNPTRHILNKLQRDAAGQIKLGLDLQGGTSFLVAMDTNALPADADAEYVLSQAVEVLRKRVDRMGVAEPVIQPAGADRILIQLPGLSETEKDQAKANIQKAAFLELRLVHPESDELLAQGLIEPGYEVLRMQQKGPGGRQAIREYLVRKKPDLTGKHIKRAMVTRHPLTNEPEIDFTLDADGAGIFAEVTRNNIGRHLAIVLDGVLYSAPVINSEISGGRGTISGQFDAREAFNLANVLENPLQAPVTIEEERTVDPSLGRDSISSGVRATLIGFSLVIAFMLVYYLLAGLVANVALLLNLLVLMGVLCSIDATLTLPGIAGILLTIGMAVDANVLIFERIREELRSGKSLRGAVSAGYGKAFGTIFDANITTLISSVILIYLGTGPVQGFGVTLTIGVAVSMFTALVVTRLVFDWLIAKEWIKSLPMLHFFKAPRIDFLRLAKPAFMLSLFLVIIGVGYGISRGKAVMGVDFAGGDAMTITFAQRVDVDEIRKVVQQVGVGEPQIQYQKDLGTGAETLKILTAFEAGPRVEAALKTQFPEAGYKVIGMDNVGPTIGAEILRTAVIAVMLALFGILIYVAFRYEFSFAIGAVVAVIHDVLMTMGWFFLTGRELSAPMVAAVLTIIGFSINDTIVIFDRIREDLKLGAKGSFKDIINRAINETLSRTIITSGTTLLSTAALYVFGGGVINDFAFTFLVGIITGTYSTIFIAAALVLWWHKGERPKKTTTVTMEGVEGVHA